MPTNDYLPGEVSKAERIREAKKDLYNQPKENFDPKPVVKEEEPKEEPKE
jgi:hypothetical protein